jgi:hypothetical protein
MARKAAMVNAVRHSLGRGRRARSNSFLASRRIRSRRRIAT